jgi:hypothetical protein
MACPLQSDDSFDVLLDYSSGKLDPARSSWLEQHSLICADCSAFLAGQTDLWQALDAWEPESVSLDFNRRLWQRIDAEAAPTWRRKLSDFFARGVWKPALPLTAAALLVVAGFVMDHQSAPAIQSAQKVADVSSGVSEIDVDQLEKTLDDLQLLSQLDSSSPAPAASRTM